MRRHHRLTISTSFQKEYGRCMRFHGRWGAIVVGLLATVACEKSGSQAPRADPPAASVPAASPVAPPPVPATLSERIQRPAPERLVALGDLHGDLEVTRRALRLAGATDAKDAWVGGNLVLVQTGDLIDRGDDDRAILDLFERLKGEAKKAGGELIAMAGNHELMNVQQDFRYVTPGAMSAFEDLHGRAAAFAPGGRYATMIAERPIVMKVGDTVFAHGGVLPKHVRYGLDKMNDEVHGWLVGKLPALAPVVASEDGVVWTRMYSAAPGREECATLGETLAALGAKRMVMGHTVQRNGISAACDDRAWRIDTGMSKFYAGKLEVLEIRGAAVTVRKLPAE
jgi:Calcineurin-like phosphoesterase